MSVSARASKEDLEAVAARAVQGSNRAVVQARWVLSFPYRVRYLLAHDAKLCSTVAMAAAAPSQATE